MGQGGTVVLEKLVPEFLLAGAVMNQSPTDMNSGTKQLVPAPCRTFPATHDHHKTVDRIEITKIDEALPERLAGVYIWQMEMKEKGYHQIFHEIVSIPKLLLISRPRIQISHVIHRSIAGSCVE